MSSTYDPVAEAAKIEAQAKAGFDRFMSTDTTKLLASMVPATEPPELLATLLRSAFNAGVASGITASSAAVSEIIASAMRGDE